MERRIGKQNRISYNKEKDRVVHKKEPLFEKCGLVDGIRQENKEVKYLSEFKISGGSRSCFLLIIPPGYCL